MSFYRGTGDVDAGTEAGRVLRSQNNLSDVANAATARTNLGLGDVATQDFSNVSITGGSIDGTTVGATTPAAGTFTDLSDSGDLAFTGTGNRITGDFSNATLANRVMFQTSTVNGNTSVGVIPNGTSTTAGINTYGASDPTNTSIAQIINTGSEASVRSGITGTGTYLPMTFYTSAGEALRIDTSKNVLVTGSGGLGYGTGSGGTVTQATSKSTAVTLNKPSGRITMNNAALAAGASVAFTVNNTSVKGGTAGDTVIINPYWGAVYGGNYRIETASVYDNGFDVRVTNMTAGSLSEAVQFNFNLIKGALS